MRGVQSELKKGDAIDRQFTLVLENFCDAELSDVGSPEKKQKFNRLIIGSSPRSLAMDEYVKALETEMATFLPIVKLTTGNYLIGTRQR